MSAAGPILAAALGASLAMALAWVWQVRTRDASFVDVLWAAGVGALALVFAFTGDGPPLRRAIVGTLGAAWAVRLALHLYVDRIRRATEEDGRYQMLRRQWGEGANRWMFVFFQAQALFVVAFSLPFLAASANPAVAPSWLDGAGVLVWFAAIVGETVADRQLARHRADPANRGVTCRAGLWRYSRHPNYFFEWLHWWGYVLLAWSSPWWWMSAGALVFMLALLFFVTGIPYTEKRALASRGDDYARYQRETSVFIPWFPKRRTAP